MMRTLLATALIALLPAMAQAAPPDYTDYQALLSRYVVQLEKPADGSDTQFDYEKLYVDDKIWITHRSATLEKVREQLVAVRPSELSAADRTAWAINTYNFLVIERATLNLLMPRRKFVRYRAVEEMQPSTGAFFSGRVAEIEGRPCSLAEFERRYVYGDSTPLVQPRTRAADPRLALALCSGHVGDPPLAVRAYRGETLEAQLEDAAHRAIALPRFARFHEDSHRLDVSDYLARRQVDMGGSAEGVVRFLERYAPQELRKAIRKYKVGKFTMALPVDRKLNQWPHPRGTPQPTPPPSDS